MLTLRQIKLKEEDSQTYQRPLLKKLAMEKAQEWQFLVQLTPQEISELHTLLLEYKKEHIPRIRELLAAFPIEMKSGFAIPYILPFLPPFHTLYAFGFLLSRLRKLKTKKLRKTKLQEYLTPEKEQELIQEYLRKGPDNFLIFDFPEPLTHTQVERVIRKKVIKILEGKSEDYRLAQNTSGDLNDK